MRLSCYALGVLRLAPFLILSLGCATATTESVATVDARSQQADAEAKADAFVPPPMPDASGADCLPLVPAEYGTPTILSSSQSHSSGNYRYYAQLVDTPFQRLFISLHRETGGFPGDIVPGNYIINDDETDYAACGACVYLAVDDGEPPSTLYMAKAAKLRLDSVDSVEGEIHGELMLATLRQIDIVYTGADCSGGAEWPCGNMGCVGGVCGVQVEVPDCTTSIDSLSF